MPSRSPLNATNLTGAKLDMNKNPVVVSCLSVLLTLGLILPTTSHADDAAASAAAGGIRLRREARISMEKERLTISDKKITVEFEFLNESDSDITTEVAFPVPLFSAYESDCGTRSNFENLKIWIEGKEIKYQAQDQALLGKTDYSDLLRDAGLTIGTFANYWEKTCEGESKDFQVPHLSPERKAPLLQLGLIGNDNFPKWKVKRLYHWTQNFPAHKLLHVRHEYEPVVGYQSYSPQELQPNALHQALVKAQQSANADPSGNGEWDTKMVEPYVNACIEPSLVSRLTEAAHRADPKSWGGQFVSTMWIDYILTSANTWKTPIKDFELIVERPASVNGAKWFVSLCWDEPIIKLDENRFSAKAENFVPKRELTVLFLANIPESSASH
jgi:hypothetical protein